MKKGIRVTLSILLPLILNFAFIIFIVLKDSTCEQKVFRHDIESQNFYFYIIWIALQIITIGLVIATSKNWKQIIALPIITLLFIALFTSWTLDMNEDNYERFDKEIWMNSCPKSN